VAIPYREVAVLVVSCGSGQVAGSASASSPPCLRGVSNCLCVSSVHESGVLA